MSKTLKTLCFFNLVVFGVILCASVPGLAEGVSSAARNYLQSSLVDLQKSEREKLSKPLDYMNALMHAASAATQCDRESSDPMGPFHSADGDRYFKLAVDFFSMNKWSDIDNASIASDLWGQLPYISPAVVDSVFEELFKASERPSEDKFRAHDTAIFFGLASGNNRRSQALSFDEQRKLLERAIAIRLAAPSDERWRASLLYDDLGYCYRDNGDLNGAVNEFLLGIKVLESSPEKQSRAILNLATFYAEHGMYDKAENAWKQATKLAVDKRLVWKSRDYESLINTFTYSKQQKRLVPLFTVLLSNGDDFTLGPLDHHLSDLIAYLNNVGEIESAVNLLKKRIDAATNGGTKSGAENWKIKLSDLYLRHGKAGESKTVFDQAISELQQKSLPVSDFKSSRAELLESLGRHGEAQALISTISSSSPGIVLPACLIVRQKLQLGGNSTITSFDSTDSTDPVSRMFSGIQGISGASGGGPSRLRGNDGDGSAILCQGSAQGPNITYNGKIYCNDSRLTPDPNRRLNVVPVGTNYVIPAALEPTSNAKSTPNSLQPGVNLLERGDYILSDLSNLTIRPQSSSIPIRVFLQDSPDKKEYTIELKGPPLSFKQFQLWYKGDKPIKIMRAGGLIYAPNADVEQKSAGFMGVLVVKNYSLPRSASLWLDRGVMKSNLTE